MWTLDYSMHRLLLRAPTVLTRLLHNADGDAASSGCAPLHPASLSATTAVAHATDNVFSLFAFLCPPSYDVDGIYRKDSERLMPFKFP